ncbi:hypothetical protein [Streptomyces sp. SP2-10]|uniref:hypothetical protein n=1 Tax=Streptomyces sp. SP2-10 TaxID=2873385 RepID=UPI00223A8AB4|nr:hypothetical protein [Streptomyces sp. SP2-10]
MFENLRAGARHLLDTADAQLPLVPAGTAQRGRPPEGLLPPTRNMNPEDGPKGLEGCISAASGCFQGAGGAPRGLEHRRRGVWCDSFGQDGNLTSEMLRFFEESTDVEQVVLDGLKMRCVEDG